MKGVAVDVQEMLARALTVTCPKCGDRWCYESVGALPPSRTFECGVCDTTFAMLIDGSSVVLK